MTKEKIQLGVIIIGIPLLVFLLAGSFKRKKPAKPVSINLEQPPLIIADSENGNSNLAEDVSNLLEIQKKRAEGDWGRDPFSSGSYDSGEFNSEFKLQGISYRKDKVGFAFINNEILKKGDSISGYEVAEVLKDKVLLKKGGQSFYLVFSEE